MNHMNSNVQYAKTVCARSIKQHQQFSKQKVSTAQETRHAQRKDAEIKALTCGYSLNESKTLDSVGTLTGLEQPNCSTRTAKRLVRVVAIVIGISLFAPMAHANTGSIEQYKYNPKKYINATMPKDEARCLRLLIGKESAWNYKAIGNLSSPTKSYVYGLLQIKNPIAKDMNPMQQIQLHMRYLQHRYDGSACNAWQHWQNKGWH